MDDIKQIIVMRRDLKMSRGKEISQGSHASMLFLLRKKSLTKVEKLWVESGMKKVCVRVDSEQELLDLNKMAKELQLECNLVKDSGKTEFGGISTLTCLALGPDYAHLVDRVTGKLKLY